MDLPQGDIALNALKLPEVLPAVRITSLDFRGGTEIMLNSISIFSIFI